MANVVEQTLSLLENNKNSFKQYNSKKYDLFLQDINKSSLEALVLILPYLISHNHPSVPGYVKGLTFREGITGYDPDENVKSLVRKNLLKGNIKAEFEHTLFGDTSSLVKMFAVMGSVGTIAYNKDSDFDFWVCYYEKDLPSEQLKLYKEKLSLITQLFNEKHKIPVHFYLNEINGLRVNSFSEEDGGGFTSTAGALLKDEFLRSSIILAGLIPFWWAVPSGLNDTKYSLILKTVKDNNAFDDYIDIGNLCTFNKSEFLGAAFFQILKSLENPFKSILKIGLLRKYLIDPNPGALFLASELKNHIHNKKFDLNVLDGYIFLYNTVRNFLASIQTAPELLALVDESFYIKGSPELSKYSSGFSNRKVTVFKKLISEWKWSAETVKKFDQFETWELKDINAIWMRLKKYIIVSYQSITNELPENEMSNSISKEDFTIISRKIEIFFSRNETKIDRWIPFKNSAYENLIYFQPEGNESAGNSSWTVSKTIMLGQTDRKTVIINTAPTLFALLSWVVINRIYHPDITQIKVNSNFRRIDTGEIKNTLIAMSNIFQTTGTPFRNNNLLKKPFITNAFTTINLHNPSEKKIVEYCFVYTNSWGESHHFSFKGEGGFVEIIKFLQKNKNESYPLLKKCYGYTLPVSAPKEANAYLQSLDEVVTFFDDKKENHNLYFFLNYGGVNLLLTNKAEKNLQSAKTIETSLNEICTENKDNSVFLGVSSQQEFELLRFCMQDFYRINNGLFIFKGQGHFIYYLLLKSGHIYKFVFERLTTDHVINVILNILFNAYTDKVPDQDYERLPEFLSIHEVMQDSRIGFKKTELTGIKLVSYIKQRCDTYQLVVTEAGDYLLKGGAVDGKNFHKTQFVPMLSLIIEQFKTLRLSSPFPTQIFLMGGEQRSPISVLNRFQHVVNSIKVLSIKLFNTKI